MEYEIPTAHLGPLGRSRQFVESATTEVEFGAAGCERPVSARNAPGCANTGHGRDLDLLVAAVARHVRGSRIGEGPRRQRALPEAQVQCQLPGQLARVEEQLATANLGDARQTRIGNLGGQSDVELERQRARDLVLEEPTQAAPLGIDAADQLALVEADRYRVIAAASSRFPGRRLCGKRLRQRVVIRQQVEIQRNVDRAEPGLVSQQLANRYVALSRLSKLRPVVGHAFVEFEKAARVCDGKRHGGHALRAGEHHDERVLLPRVTRLRIASPTPEINDLLTILVDRNRSAELSAQPEILGEGGTHGLEAAAHLSVDRCAIPVCVNSLQ